MSAIVCGFVSAISGDSDLEASGVESEVLSSGSKLSVVYEVLPSMYIY